MSVLLLVIAVVFGYALVRLLFKPRTRRFPVENHTCIVMKDGSMLHDASCRCNRRGGGK